MIGFIWRLIVGRFKMPPLPVPCAHKWKQVHAVDVYDRAISMENPVAFKFVLRCEHCGDMKTFRT